jgi:hypothetical protein
MKQRTLLVLLLALTLILPGCDFVGDVLEFGLWLVLIAVVVIALLIWAVYAAFFD